MLMEILQSMMLAIIQGFTEVFPISSSGHLAVYGRITGQEISFEKVVLFHFGTFLAISFFYRKDIIDIFAGKMGWKIPGFMLISFAATSLVGLVVEGSLVDSVIRHPRSVALLWLVNGLLVAFVGFRSRPGFKKMADLKMKEYLVIGIAQGIAATPGISRLGLTLGAGLLQQMTWSEALKLSFLLSLPTIFAASLVTFLQSFDIGSIKVLSFSLTKNSPDGSQVIIAIFIIVTTLIYGLMALRIMYRFLGRRLLFFFGLYCITAGSFFWLYFGLP